MSVLLTSAFIILTPQELSSLHLSLILQMGAWNAVCPPELTFQGFWHLAVSERGTANITQSWYCSELEVQDDTALQTNQDCSHCEMSEISSRRCSQALRLPLPSSLTAHLSSTDKTHDYFWNICFCLISAACRIQSLGKEPCVSSSVPPQGRAEALGTRSHPVRVNIKRL